MTIQIDEEKFKRKDDYNFKECLKYAPFSMEEVDDILACIPGEADGDNWHYIVKLTDGKFGYVTGWCDYSGWGCQENGEGAKTDTVEEAIKKAPTEKDEQEILRKQVLRETSYGLH